MRRTLRAEEEERNKTLSSEQAEAEFLASEHEERPAAPVPKS